MTSRKSFWYDFCENSSLRHGLQYVVHKESKLWERLMWAVLLAVASGTILVHLYASWETFSYSSMQIVVDDPRYPLSKIDFPAITVCSINKILYSKAKRLILNKYEHDPETMEKYENSLYVLGMLQYPYYKDLSLFTEKNPTVNLPAENITELMLSLMPSVDEMFYSCFWRGTGYNCSDLMRLQRTEEGFCYSFNSKTSERTPNDSKFNPPMVGPNDMLIPLRNNAAGKMTGLELILRSLITEYFPVDIRSKGFNIMVHTPEDFPDVSNSYKIYSELNQSSQISVKVSQIRADESINRLSEKDRTCFMYKLRTTRQKSFPSYWSNAEDNCYSKCRLKTTAEICGCMPYYFNVERKSEDKWNSCGIEHIQCLGKMDVLQHNSQVPEDEPGFPDWSIPVFMNCSCPHPCSFIGYTTEMQNFPKDTLEYSLFPNAYIHIDIHYKERFAISYQRFMKYTVQDLLVTFGGMASLFLGCSLVSIVEIVYTIYKSLLMLKYKRTKIKTVSEEQVFALCRQNRINHLCKAAYKPTANRTPTATGNNDYDLKKGKNNYLE